MIKTHPLGSFVRRFLPLPVPHRSTSRRGTPQR
jgi:hypothetical protein